jgi:hypothetical protein
MLIFFDAMQGSDPGVELLAGYLIPKPIEAVLPGVNRHFFGVCLVAVTAKRPVSA